MVYKRCLILYIHMDVTIDKTEIVILKKEK